jgi:hypothetical protein
VVKEAVFCFGMRREGDFSTSRGEKKKSRREVSHSTWVANFAIIRYSLP